MSEPFKVLRDILKTGNTHPDFFAMCDLLETSNIVPDSMSFDTHPHSMTGEVHDLSSLNARLPDSG
jgi:hypothetical protein